MSYARHDGVRSEVYVIAGWPPGLGCLGCKLEGGPGYHYSCARRSTMLRHLLKHRKAGHKVPRYATDRLRREIRELGD